MSRTKQRPSVFGLGQPSARTTRSSLSARAHLQSQAHSQAHSQAQHTQSQPQPSYTRARRRADGAPIDLFLTQDIEGTMQQRSNSSLFAPLEVVSANRMEPEDGEGDAAERNMGVDAAAQEIKEVEDIEDSEDERIEAADDIDDADDMEEVGDTEAGAKDSGKAATADEIQDVDADVYESNYDELPPKRKRVALSASPKAAKQKSASAKGRRQTVANVVQVISDAMAMASPKPAMTAAPLEAGENGDVTEPDAGVEEANVEVEEQLAQTQEGDAIVVAGSGDEVAEGEDDAESIFDVYVFSDSDSVPTPPRNQPPRKMAANPTINVPPEARRTAIKAASEKMATQGIKRKRGRPKKIHEPIIMEQESLRRPTRTSKVPAKETHPPPTRITESSLQSKSQHRESPPEEATVGLPPSSLQEASGGVEFSPIREPSDADFAPDSDNRSGPFAARAVPDPIKVVQFNTEMVSSLVALMCRDGWTGQRMWKGTFRWYHQGHEQTGVTYQAYHLMAELGKLEEMYRNVPSLEDSDEAPHLSNVLRHQEYLLEEHPVLCQDLADSEAVIMSNLLAICEMLYDSILPPSQTSNDAAHRDTDNARRFRAIVADDFVSYVIPMVVCLIETACCLGGRKLDGGPVEAGFYVPLKTVRMSRIIWDRVNKATLWLVRLESALAQELGYREQRNMSLAVADAKGTSSSALAHNGAQSGDRAHLKRLLNRLQDDLCEARNRLEGNPQYEPGQMPEFIDLTDLGRDSDAQRIDNVGEDKDKEEVEEGAEMHIDANAQPKAKAKAKRPARQKIAKPTYQLEESDTHTAPDAQGQTSGRAQSIEILIPSQAPQSTEVAEAAGEGEADVAGETANDEAADAAVVDAIAVANDEGAAGDEEEEQQEEPAPARPSAAEKENEKTPKPKSSAFIPHWDDDEDITMFITAPPETVAVPANTDPIEDSQGTSMFVRQHSEVPEQPVDVEAVVEDGPPPAPALVLSPSPFPSSALAPAPTPLPAQPAPKTARKRAKLLAAQDSQDHPVSSDFTRDEKKMILALLRTKGASFDLVRLAAEMGREALDVAKRVESIKTAFRERELRLGNTSPPAWMQAGYKLDSLTEPSFDA